jgi:hypothetical protein
MGDEVFAPLYLRFRISKFPFSRLSTIPSDFILRESVAHRAKKYRDLRRYFARHLSSTNWAGGPFKPSFGLSGAALRAKPEYRRLLKMMRPTLASENPCIPAGDHDPSK